MYEDKDITKWFLIPFKILFWIVMGIGLYQVGKVLSYLF